MSERSILVVAAHPDDETFGCGGTLALNVSNGNRVYIISLTCPEEERRNELIEASKALGAEKPIIFGEKELAFNSEIIHRVSDVIVSKRPELVVTHLHWDYHREHRVSYELVKEAIEWAAHTTAHSDAWRVRRLLLMEVNTLIPTPHVLVDISDVFERKLRAIECHATQLSKFPEGYYQSFSKAKAELRGVQGGCSYAEAFFEEPLARNSPFFESKSTKNLFE